GLNPYVRLLTSVGAAMQPIDFRRDLACVLLFWGLKGIGPDGDCESVGSPERRPNGSPKGHRTGQIPGPAQRIAFERVKRRIAGNLEGVLRDPARRLLRSEEAG